MQETQQLLQRTRASIRQERRRMQKQQRHPMDVSPAASIHRMLKSDGLPSHLLSVVDSSGSLIGSPDELKAVMADHFQSVFFF
jgi:hypothetical protein